MNQQNVEAFVGQVVVDMAAGMSGVMTSIGRRLGLYKAMAGAGPLTPAELARKTKTHERYVQEWLNNQAAGGYVKYHPGNCTYELPEEHALVLAHEDSPAYMAAGLEAIASMWFDEDKIAEAFRSGNGVGWHEHHPRLFHGTEYFYRTGYRANLTSQWIPALEGVEEKLRRGANVADVGCGHGASTIIMAQAYPRSAFWGFDYHSESVQIARQRAAEAGVSERICFETASAKDYPGAGYDLICLMDCFHDLGDPRGAAEHARASLADGGTLMLVEPNAGDHVEENLTPVGRLFYAASTAVCTPNSLSQEVGMALGAQAGEKRLADVLRTAGFRHVRRAAETPFNIVIEARA